MLKNITLKQGVLHEHGYILCVEVEDGGPTPERVINAISDALTFIEGVGKVETNYMGQFEDIPGGE